MKKIHYSQEKNTHKEKHQAPIIEVTQILILGTAIFYFCGVMQYIGLTHILFSNLATPAFNVYDMAVSGFLGIWLMMLEYGRFTSSLLIGSVVSIIAIINHFLKNSTLEKFVSALISLMLVFLLGIFVMDNGEKTGEKKINKIDAYYKNNDSIPEGEEYLKITLLIPSLDSIVVHEGFHTYATGTFSALKNDSTMLILPKKDIISVEMIDLKKKKEKKVAQKSL